MGNVHSLSSEAILGGIAIIAGVVYYYIQPPTTNSQTDQSTSSNANKKGKKKNSKKPPPPADEKAPISTPPSKDKAGGSPIVVGFPTVLPGQFDAESVASDEHPSKSKKSKKKKGKGKDKPTTAGASSAESSTPVPPSKPKQKRSSPSDPSTSKSTLKSPPSIDTDGSWTRVESHNRKAKQAAGDQQQPSLSVTTETETGDSSPVAERTDEDKDVRAGWSSNENRKTLAEKLLPKPRKTAVDDMLETPDYPALSRVMRVQPRPDEKPASGFSWGDYEDVHVDGGATSASGVAAGAEHDADADGDGEQDDNDGWGVVKSKGRAKQSQNSSSSQSQSTKTQPSSTEQTKRQRQNAAKREAQKAAKASAEADRLTTLAKHKRELERAKMVEQFASGGGGKGGQTSGGMKASVDANGKLVWE